MCVNAMKSEGRFSLPPAEYEDQPISRTYQYRKVMKPMLERKRRARINRCLDELKELMVAALQAEGENVSKLEKADILELTVSHLHKLRRQHALTLAPEQSTYTDRFRAGFTQCAAEVSAYLATAPVATAVDPSSTAKLLQHLGMCIRSMDAKTYQQQQQQQNADDQYTPPSSPTQRLVPQKTSVVRDNKEDDALVWRPW